MDSLDQLLHLRQGGLSIEEYVHQFCELSFQVPLYDEFLFKDLFHFGLNRHIKSLFHESLFPGGEFNGSLRGLMDCALLYAGSSFTVGVAERNATPRLTKWRGNNALSVPRVSQHACKLLMSCLPSQGLLTVMPAKPGPARVMTATPESLAKMATTPADATLWPRLIACVLDAPLVRCEQLAFPGPQL